MIRHTHFHAYCKIANKSNTSWALQIDVELIQFFCWCLYKWRLLLAKNTFLGKILVFWRFFHNRGLMLFVAGFSCSMWDQNTWNIYNQDQKYSNAILRQ
jgi:hypothetical protein